MILHYDICFIHDSCFYGCMSKASVQKLQLYGFYYSLVDFALICFYNSLPSTEIIYAEENRKSKLSCTFQQQTTQHGETLAKSFELAGRTSLTLHRNCIELSSLDWNPVQSLTGEIVQAVLKRRLRFVNPDKASLLLCFVA